MSLLDRINEPNDIKKLKKEEMLPLAQEIRAFLIEKVSKTGGHLASNLGCVELTIALHLAMHFPEDKLIFDVGHQSYTHKLLTGRRNAFDTLRQEEGLAGFPKGRESECDAFDTGHSTTGISAAMGYAAARDLEGGNEKIACVIGDGSMTGGMAYESLNCLSQQRNGLVIILNDNEMSIDKNVGGLSKYLNKLRVGSAYNDLKSGVENTLISTKTGEKVAKTIKRSKDSIKQLFVPGMFFEELGITYVGPIDGHDIPQMVKTFQNAFRLNKPIMIHVKTRKGLGYAPAEEHPDYFHGISPFDIKTGKVLEEKKQRTYTDIFAKHMVTLGEQNEKLVAITAAMSIGTGLNRFEAVFPERFFDVGIAEQHAVTFAAGLAKAGMIPVVAIYSSFLQRAYDQILHDVCLQNLHIIFAVDRSGLVGQDGETHQGIYGTSYLSHMPGLTVLAPKNRFELMAMMEYAVACEGPVAILYPRGAAYKGLADFQAPIAYGKSELIVAGSRVLIFACGHMAEEATHLVHRLREAGIYPTLVNVRFLSSVDIELLKQLLSGHELIVVMEENITQGGYYEMLSSALVSEGLYREGLKLINAGIRAGSVAQGSIAEQRKRLQIDAESIFARVMREIKD